MHRFILEPYKGAKTRHICPICGKKETFSRYIDIETREYIHTSVGKCNREVNCGHHLTPKQYFKFSAPIATTTAPTWYKSRPLQARTPEPKKTAFFIDENIFLNSIKGFETNNFVHYLNSLFGKDVSDELIKKYFIGTSKNWEGACVFWQIDTQGNVRTGKIMLYNPTTGKRVKEPFNHISWVHSALKIKDFELSQCLFGEHLLNDKTKDVAIVESEKTAIVASVFFPEFIWLATGGMSFNSDKCKVLEGRDVFLFPDLSKPKIEGKPTAFQIWTEKTKELSHLANFFVSDLFEKTAKEWQREKGWDICDFLTTAKENDKKGATATQLYRYEYTAPEVSATLTGEYYYTIEQLQNFARCIVEPFNSFTKKQIIETLQTKTNADTKTALNTFHLLADNGILTQYGTQFHLTDSSPF